MEMLRDDVDKFLRVVANFMDFGASKTQPLRGYFFSPHFKSQTEVAYMACCAMGAVFVGYKQDKLGDWLAVREDFRNHYQWTAPDSNASTLALLNDIAADLNLTIEPREILMPWIRANHPHIPLDEWIMGWNDMKDWKSDEGIDIRRHIATAIRNIVHEELYDLVEGLEYVDE